MQGTRASVLYNVYGYGRYTWDMAHAMLDGTHDMTQDTTLYWGYLQRSGGSGGPVASCAHEELGTACNPTYSGGVRASAG